MIQELVYVSHTGSSSSSIVLDCAGVLHNLADMSELKTTETGSAEWLVQRIKHTHTHTHRGFRPVYIHFVKSIFSLVDADGERKNHNVYDFKQKLVCRQNILFYNFLCIIVFGLNQCHSH